MRKILHYWKPYELAWLICFCGMAIGVTLITHDSWFGFIVFISGVLCVLLVAKGSIWNYAVGIVNTLGYAWISWQNGLFGEVGLNLAFYFPMNIVGIIMWRGHLKDGIVRMLKLSARGIAWMALVCAGSIVGLGLVLDLIPTQNTPYIDAATTALSVIATILMLKRYREQWILYISLNVLTVVMWSIRWAAGSSDGPLMVVMWSAYLINAVYGLINWTRGANAEQDSAKSVVAEASVEAVKTPAEVTV